ncbi:putative low-complexity protein [Leptolyngbyaceae cyanobacterium JSC-12]|nr:putative low-complexity protein [Leptolyngbyaceae cyanobacterium JSC-12]
MKASEVLRRYAAGDRDFRRTSLRGQHFKGQDLSGADFSEADIRGTNFTHANLKGTNFTNAKAGLQKRWVLIQLLLVFLLAALAGVLQGYFSWWISGSIVTIWEYFHLPTEAEYQVSLAILIDNIIYLTIYLIVIVTTIAMFTRQGFTSKAFASVAGAGAGAGASVLLGFYYSRQALKGDEKFALLRAFGIAVAALGGTSFCGANLTDANFTNAMLRSTNFQATRQQTTLLNGVYWHNANQLDRARLGDSILSNSAVRELLVTRNGYKKSYIDANLRGANLNGVNLEAANLTWADLSQATLHQANLKDANLREVLAIGTDFTAAYLTGACLEGWNIDHTTTLKAVDCQYIFLLEHPNQLGNRERRPHEPDQVFAPGDFAKLYTKMINVVQVLLRNGMNRTAFAAAFQQLMSENPDITYDSIQAVERQGDDALVTLSVSETANKAEISRTLRESYENQVRQLEAKVEELHQLRAADLKEVALAQKSQIFNQLVGGNAMNESIDRSQNINVDGNFTITATNSVVNLGEISGTVSNAIHQLQQSSQPETVQLAAWLDELQGLIEAEPNLKDDDKVEALEQVGTLAKAGENPQDSTLKKLSNTAVKILKGTIAALPDTAKLAEACSKLLPLISGALGL